MTVENFKKELLSANLTTRNRRVFLALLEVVESQESGGEVSPEINVFSEGNLAVPNGSGDRIITVTGLLEKDIILPSISDSIGAKYFITNASEELIFIKSKTGSNDIWFGGTMVNQRFINKGAVMTIVNDGVNFKIR